MTQDIVSSESNNKYNGKNEKGKTALYTVMSVEDFRKNAEKFPYHKEMLHSLGSIRYCKAEAYNDCVFGTFRLPGKRHDRTAALSFGFFLTKQSLTFIENEGKLKPWLEKHSEILFESKSSDQLFLNVLKLMTDDDMMYLLHIEAEADEMEDELINDKVKDIFPTLTKYRRKLSELNAYYEQLADICEVFQSDACRGIVKDAQAWSKFVGHAERLQGHVHILRENMLQLRELEQSIRDSRQNRIIGILTIVATIFLPLTLLTGWYGMNFEFMPELKWKYGYLVVIVATAVITIGEFIYFKKKKFF